MPIKQLQLRGISRTPSDRATSDGGCAESLNVHLDQSETAPTLPPEDYSDEAYGTSVTAANRSQIIFIHKMKNGVKNYIGYKKVTGASPSVTFYAYGSNLSGGYDAIFNSTGSSEEFAHATSIGNLLIIYMKTSPHYFLFDGSEYTRIDSIPVPQIEIASLPNDPRYASSPVLDETLKTITAYPWNVWNGAMESTSELHGGLLSAMAGIWESVAVEMQNIRSEGKFVAPFFIRYALKMYDGNYIHASAPVLCGGFAPKNGFSEDWLTMNLSQTGPVDERVYEMSATFNTPFTVYIRCGNPTVWNNLTSIVESIDFFASTPIYAPEMNAGYAGMDSSQAITLDKMDSASKASTVLNEVLSKGQFYKILSIAVNDSENMGKLSDGSFILKNADSVSGDLLLTQDTMPETYRDGSVYIPMAEAKSFNNRALLVGAEETIGRGNYALNGQAGGHGSVYTWPTTRPGVSYYYLRFKIEDSSTGEVHYIGARKDNGPLNNACFCYDDSTMKTYLKSGASTGSYDRYNKCVPYAWIAYPDTRCTDVEVVRPGSNAAYKVAMKPHPLLECSYAFLGFGVAYDSISGTSTSYSSDENPKITAENKVFLSEFENPYLFPAENIVTFPDKVVGLAATSVPLSEGQFGEHTMYAFTEGGIRVLGVNAEGTFSAEAVHPHLGRYVALPGTILSIEQAVIFATKKGVMLLSGNAVTELSANMNGAPFRLTGETGSDMRSINDSLVQSDWKWYLTPTVSSKTFMWYMENAKPAYDHNSSRIIFFKEGETWQYVYHLDTQTWHKMYFYDKHIENVIVLNSYPDCLISSLNDNDPTNLIPSVFNFSTSLNSETVLAPSASPVYGIIATRPFDLGEPDIRKAIRSIRIRGNYNRGDAQYLLLGSFDGLNWHWMKSLRGGSYKQFRMVLLTKLQPTERITWIDVDYESRFTNRLR